MGRSSGRPLLSITDILDINSLSASYDRRWRGFFARAVLVPTVGFDA
jgi:hypothetical protein